MSKHPACHAQARDTPPHGVNDRRASCNESSMLARELTLTDYLGVSGFSPAETHTLLALARAAARIAAVLARGKRAAFAGHDNVHGEHVRDYDVIANEHFVKELSQAPGCAGVLSEELA